MGLALLLSLGAAVGGTPLPAQDETPQVSEGQKRFDALMMSLQEDLGAARVRAQEEAERAGETFDPRSWAPPTALVAKHLEAFRSAAREFRGKDDALLFLKVLITMAGAGDDIRRQHRTSILEVCDTVATVYVQSAGLRSLVPTIARLRGIVGGEEVDRVLRLIEEGSPHRDIQARAILGRIAPVLHQAELKSAAFAEAKKEAARAIEIAESDSMKRRIRNTVAQRELGAGARAPEITGVDLDGKAFQLSDYRGKVILLDFWGDW